MIGITFKLSSDIIRAATLIAALLAFSTGRGSAGIFILVTFVVTLAFKWRKLILLEETQAADRWEFGVLLLFFINAVLLLTGWYYNPRLVWIDIPLHFLGGLLVGIWAWLVFGRGPRAHSFIHKWVLIFGVTALVGVSWEFFEWILDHVLSQWYVFPRNQPSVDDTLGDLFMDLLGGVVGGFLAAKKIWSK